ncbi:uncharacterized protein LOC114909366 [Scleropages formosus]|uniref:Uncharacterized LOC114909366 n=1 Tax=Scleropages formosus TaxID=113540 RepID=A0A8C9TUT6_SCLFO|nr:uncharacterized protein LOC114909366 [Scleropages formosus]
MRGLLTTQSQDCYREQIEKEIYTRLAWNIRYGQQYLCRPAARRARKPGFPSLPAPKVTLPPVEQTAAAETEEKRKAVRSIPAPGESESFAEISLMRPVSPGSKELLNEGLSTQGSGRTLYLRRRLEKNPEEKYPHPELSSWEYGWRLGDYVKEFRCPANGRSGIVRDTFYARNGIFSIASPTDRVQ